MLQPNFLGERYMSNHEKNSERGRLEVICGSMFSGKTEELMRRLKRAEHARQGVLTIKHQVDDRSHRATIISHDGRERTALAIDGSNVSVDKILELAKCDINVIGIDEVQFFPNRILDVICELVDQGRRVIVAGLDLDFRGEPFGIMPLLLTIADEVIKLKAICVICAKDAHHSQRIINNQPARYDDPIIFVGASECYEARCRNCFQIDKKPKLGIANKFKQQTIF